MAVHLLDLSGRAGAKSLSFARAMTYILIQPFSVCSTERVEAMYSLPRFVLDGDEIFFKSIAMKPPGAPRKPAMRSSATHKPVAVKAPVVPQKPQAKTNIKLAAPVKPGATKKSLPIRAHNSSRKQSAQDQVDDEEPLPVIKGETQPPNEAQSQTEASSPRKEPTQFEPAEREPPTIHLLGLEKSTIERLVADWKVRHSEKKSRILIPVATCVYKGFGFETADLNRSHWVDILRSYSVRKIVSPHKVTVSFLKYVYHIKLSVPPTGISIRTRTHGSRVEKRLNQRNGQLSAHREGAGGSTDISCGA